MLEPIRLGQGRTHCPGLAADERGVVMGRRLALLFPDLSRTVGFFRSFSREVSLDDVLASLAIRESVSERGGHEVCVSFDVAGSFTADRAAQAGRMHRGRIFSGTDPHYVPYRDRRSPLGYDVSAPEDVITDPHDIVLYGEAGADRRRFGRTIALAELILGLSPRPLSASERATESPDAIVVRCEQGIGRALCRYLWSRQVRATVAMATSAKHSLFSGKAREILLVRCDGMPRHIVQLVHKTPGMRAYVPVQPHLLVEWGFRHPIALESCGNALPSDVVHLLHGPPNKVERVIPSADPADIRDLVDVTLTGTNGPLDTPAPAPTEPLETLDVELRLARLPRAHAATTALLIERERLPWFVKLIYMLPSAILRTYECALAGPYIVVVNRRGVHGIPFGEPMTEMAPQVFVPVGMQLLPRVDYDLLREHLQIRPDQHLYFFPEGKTPFLIAVGELKPLSRAVVAPERARQSMLELRSDPLASTFGPPTVSHKRQGMLSLWRGTRGPEEGEPKALPPHTPTPAEKEE